MHFLGAGPSIDLVSIYLILKTAGKQAIIKIDISRLVAAAVGDSKAVCGFEDAVEQAKHVSLAVAGRLEAQDTSADFPERRWISAGQVFVFRQ